MNATQQSIAWLDLSPEEQEAMLQAAINTKIAHGDPVEDIFTQALYVVRSQKT